VDLRTTVQAEPHRVRSLVHNRQPQTLQVMLPHGRELRGVHTEE
jgi:hypothetical protein